MSHIPSWQIEASYIPTTASTRAAKISAYSKDGALPLPMCQSIGHGRTVRQLKRCDKYAIYSLWVDGRITTYEVFKIRIQREVVRKFPNGRVGKYPKSERYPRDTDFGKWAKSCATLSRAEDQYECLCKYDRFLLHGEEL